MEDLFETLNPRETGKRDSMSVRNGLALAKVTDIKDPKNHGRVKCVYITADKSTKDTGWIYCLTPFGGNEYGAFFHPNVNDIVALAYENGDAHRPFVIGCLWRGEQKPPVGITDGKNEEYKFITPNKSFVTFTDTKSKEKITVSTPKNRQIILDDENKEMSVSDGKNTLKITEKDGKVAIKCDKKLVIEVGSGVKIECDGTSGKVEIKANKELKLSAAQISEKASGTLEVSGGSSTTVKSSGMLTLKGSMTKIN